ncbi:lipid II flippase MurJ [Polymorphospora sp. NPDC051019]
MGTPGTVTGAGRIAGAAALIAVLTVASRLAGFARTGVFTWVVGGTDLGGVYLIANTVPNIIFEIVAGGALASLVVPLLAGAIAAGDRAAVAATTGALLTWTVTLLVPLAVVVAVFAGPIVAAIANDPTPAEVAVGARMLRIFAPQLPLYGIGIVLTGVLQAHRRFAWPVIAPLLSSVTVMAAYLVFAGTQGRGVDIAGVDLAGELILAVGTTAGVVVLSLSLLIPLRALRLRPAPTYAFDADARRRVGGLAVAGAVTVAGQQVALLVSLNLVSGGATGVDAVVPYNLAQTIYLLPWSVLAVPLAVAAYPALAAAHTTGDEDGYRATLAPTVRRVLLLATLGAAALTAVARLVAQFFFTGVAAEQAAAGIVGFAPGLLGYGLFAVLSRALYARGDTRAAAVATGLGWLAVPAAAVLLAAAVPDDQRVPAVTGANSVGMVVLGAVLVVAVARRAGPGAVAGLPRAAGVALLAGGLAALAGTVVGNWLAGAGLSLWPAADAGGGTPAHTVALLQGMLAGAVVALVFAGVAYPLDRHDLRPMVAAVGRRLRGGRRDGPDRHDDAEGTDPR